MPTRAVAYIRVSTDKQAAEGVSLEAQEAKIRAYATVYDLEIVAIEIGAGESAKNMKRPALQRALERLERFEAEALLVVKLDRLTRNVRDLCELVDTYFRDGSCSLLSVSEQIDTRSAAGRMMLNMLTTIGQWEREAIGERTAAAMQHMRAQGKFTGGYPPFGYYVNDAGELAENVTEQDVVQRARSLRHGGWPLRTIADQVGPNPRTGKPFNAEQISRMIERDEALKSA